MRSTKGKNLSMAVVRGGHPRMAEAHFYSHFKKFKIKLIGDSRTGWINNKNFSNNIDFVNTSLYPVWRVDPWTLLFGRKYVHRAFQFLTDLEKLVSDCDVINISDLFYFYCWQSALIAKRLNKKLVAIVWENVLRHPSVYIPPYCFGVRAALKETDLFIARSQKAKEYLLSIGADKEKIKVIYKGINMSEFTPKERERDGKIRILYIGQLVKSKGILELISAFERLVKEFHNLELYLLARANNDSLYKFVRDKARYLPIVVNEQLDYGEVPKIYQNADIYCHLSQDWKYLELIKGGNDWFPYAIIEAMASGLPIVATNVGGIPEQLGNVGNVVALQKNAESAYQGLKKMIQNERLRERVGERNRKRCLEMFDIKKQAKKTEEAILELFS